jgi:hypothetical protein
MTIRKKSAVLGLIVAFLLILYSAAKFNSSYLVEYVVGRTLIQKAPPGTDPAEIQEGLQKLLASAPTREEKLERLFRISAYLEKVQELSTPALAEILEGENPDVFIR